MFHLQDPGLPGGLANSSSGRDASAAQPNTGRNHSATEPNLSAASRQKDLHPGPQTPPNATEASVYYTGRLLWARTVLLAGFTPAGPLPAWGSCGAPLHASELAGSRCLRRTCSGSPAAAKHGSGQQDMVSAALLRQGSHSQACTATAATCSHDEVGLPVPVWWPARIPHCTTGQRETICKQFKAQRGAFLMVLRSSTADSDVLLKSALPCNSGRWVA